MDIDFLLWLIGYCFLALGNYSLWQTIKRMKRLHALELRLAEDACLKAYATGWRHAFEDLGISGSRRLSE